MGAMVELLVFLFDTRSVLWRLDNCYGLRSLVIARWIRYFVSNNVAALRTTLDLNLEGPNWLLGLYTDLLATRVWSISLRATKPVSS